MRPAVDSRDFLLRPKDRYLLRETWVAFCVGEEVSGVVAWGSPGSAEATGLLEVIAVRGSPLASPMARWLDLRRLETHQDAFSVFANYLTANAHLLGRAVTRAAVLHSGP